MFRAGSRALKTKRTSAERVFSQKLYHTTLPVVAGAVLGGILIADNASARQRHEQAVKEIRETPYEPNEAHRPSCGQVLALLTAVENARPRRGARRKWEYERETLRSMHQQLCVPKTPTEISRLPSSPGSAVLLGFATQ